MTERLGEEAGLLETTCNTTAVGAHARGPRPPRLVERRRHGSVRSCGAADGKGGRATQHGARFQRLNRGDELRSAHPSIIPSGGAHSRQGLPPKSVIRSQLGHKIFSANLEHSVDTAVWY